MPDVTGNCDVIYGGSTTLYASNGGAVTTWYDSQ